MTQLTITNKQGEKFTIKISLFLPKLGINKAEVTIHNKKIERLYSLENWPSVLYELQTLANYKKYQDILI